MHRIAEMVGLRQEEVSEAGHKQTFLLAQGLQEQEPRTRVDAILKILRVKDQGLVEAKVKEVLTIEAEILGTIKGERQTHDLTQGIAAHAFLWTRGMGHLRMAEESQDKKEAHM